MVAKAFNELTGDLNSKFRHKIFGLNGYPEGDLYDKKEEWFLRHMNIPSYYDYSKTGNDYWIRQHLSFCHKGNKKNEICFKKEEEEPGLLGKTETVLGLAIINNRTNEFDIIFNFDYWIEQRNYFRRYRRFKQTLLHELLHAFVRGHSENPKSAMYKENFKNKKQDLIDDEIWDHLLCVYK